MQYDVLIIGGGAAGLMCALTAGQRGQRVLLIEHANRVGKKILMSGGGRCNFTNLHTTPSNFLSRNPHFCKSALARYRPAQFIAMVERHGIAYHEKELGQLFCDESSKLIVRMLLDECAAAKVRIEVDCAVQQVQFRDGRYSIDTPLGRATAPVLVVATGGLSIPSMGATGFGYELARQFGHTLVPTRAGLVPLTLSGTHQEHYAALAGVALPIVARCGAAAFRTAMLITHRGLSGPAILQISSFWEPGQPLTLDLLPDEHAADWLAAQQTARPASELKTVLGDVLPKRFAQRLCEVWFENRALHHLKKATLREYGERLQRWSLTASGTEGYRTAEVTLGGVDTDELSSATMESKRQPGLYFIGEVVDVTGHLGGFNFQWAWASAHAAATAIAERGAS